MPRPIRRSFGSPSFFFLCPQKGQPRLPLHNVVPVPGNVFLTAALSRPVTRHAYGGTIVSSRSGSVLIDIALSLPDGNRNKRVQLHAHDQPSSNYHSSWRSTPYRLFGVQSTRIAANSTPCSRDMPSRVKTPIFPQFENYDCRSSWSGLYIEFPSYSVWMGPSSSSKDSQCPRVVHAHFELADRRRRFRPAT